MSIYDTLNPMQKEAVLYTEGPLLILAGAGSGKTRVLTHRICYLIEEKQVNPWNILAITFTNKAAGEMRERVDNLVGNGSESIWVSTFHSMCVRILRRYIDKLGYNNNFTIYDTDDQKRIIKDIVKHLQMDAKIYTDKVVVNEISKAKEQYLTPAEYEHNNLGDFRKSNMARIYREYQKRLKSNNALDFDDLLFKTVELFEFNPAILDQYQERFKYIMVDEYQDTNHIQFLLIKFLAGKYKNLCVVGDDDQSIYKFRGANIYNILNFEEEYDTAKVIKLEQNYRSTKNILNAANNVIQNNTGRKDKTLWTDNDEGDLINYSLCDTEYNEADVVINEIERLNLNENIEYNNFAILYRTNAQSRIYEEKLLYKNIPYKIVGGQNFYGRKEIKDLISYLKTIENGSDDLSVARIINVPKRGIGVASVEKAREYAMQYEISLLDAMFEVEGIPGLGRAVGKITEFTDLIADMRDLLKNGCTICELFNAVLEKTGYWNELLVENTEESKGRLENIDELRNKIIKYEEEAENPSLGELLEEIALVADIDSLDENQRSIVLMTLHSAKGLEFPYVFLGGMEDGLFPSNMAINSDDRDAVEEERRLCYVGITRAMKKLYLSSARTRMVHGSTNFNTVSRFIKEIPEELLDNQKSKTVRRNAPADLFDRPRKYSNERGDSSFSGYGESSSFQDDFIFDKVRDNKNFPNTAYSKETKKNTNKVQSTAYFGKEFVVNKAQNLEYEEGDTVQHIKFGKGKVIKIESGGKDYEVTVNFDAVGIKRMFASFAKLKKI